MRPAHGRQTASLLDETEWDARVPLLRQVGGQHEGSVSGAQLTMICTGEQHRRGGGSEDDEDRLGR